MVDDTKRLDGNGLARVWTATQKLVADNINDGVPVNGVVEFDGLEADIPDGYTKIGTRDSRLLIKKGEKTIPVRSTVVNEETASDTDVYSCEYINELNTYSTNEKVVGTWINGKPLYRKVFTYNIDTANVQNTITHNISNLGWVSRCDVAMYNEYDFYITGSSLTGSFETSLDGTSIYLKSLIYTGDCTIIIEYTKTTD